MEHIETDISYLLGRYLGVARRVEMELDRLMKKETESVIEANFDDFVEKPAEAFKRCMEVIKNEQKLLKNLNRTELVEESNEILKMVNVGALEHITLNAPNFLHGYHVQLSTYEGK